MIKPVAGYRPLAYLPRKLSKQSGPPQLDRFEEVTKRAELMLEFTLQPGEMYFINNYTVLHARTAFDDGDAEDDQRRHLLRLWLEVAGMRPVYPLSDATASRRCPAER